MYKISIVAIILMHFFISVNATAEESKLLAGLKKSNPDTNKVLLYKKLSQFYEYSRPDSAIEYAKQGLALSAKLNYRKGEGIMLNQLGVINEKHDNLTLAKKFIKDGLMEFEAINYQPGMADSYNSLGVIEGKLGNYKPATVYFLKALKINENIKDRNGIVQSLIKLGVINEHSNNLDKALQYYIKAQKLNPGKKSNADLTLYNNIGIVYARKGQYKKALTYFEAGIKKSKGDLKVDVMASLLDNAGNASLELGEKEKAFEYYRQALDKARIYNMPEKEARSLLNLAYFLHVTNGVMSLDYLNKALDISIKIGNKRLTSEIYTAISDFYKGKNNHKAALFALEEHNKYADSLFNLDKKFTITTLQSAYEIAKSKAEIRNLQLANEKQALQRNIFIIVSISVLIILIGMVLYIMKVKKLNKQLVESNAIKDKLFSIIGHDLRTPVINLVQMMDLMDDMTVSSEERSLFIAALKKQSEASLETLDNLLHWGKAQLQGIRVKPNSILLKPVFEKNLASFNLQIRKKSIIIKNLIPEFLIVITDSDHLNFVIRNLISNAVKFTYPSGSIQIDAIQKDADFITITVRDDGVGINEENRNSIFKTFPVIRNGTANEKGTGIGLMLCKEFVEANGGLIWLESNPGNGTSISFTLRGSITSILKNELKEIAG